MSSLFVRELEGGDLALSGGAAAAEGEPTSVDVDRWDRDFVASLTSWHHLACPQGNGACAPSDDPDLVLSRLESTILRLVTVLDRFGDRDFGDRFVAALDAFDAGRDDRLDSGHPESVRQIWAQACRRAALLLDRARE